MSEKIKQSHVERNAILNVRGPAQILVYNLHFPPTEMAEPILHSVL